MFVDAALSYVEAPWVERYTTSDDGGDDSTSWTSEYCVDVTLGTVAPVWTCRSGSVAEDTTV